MLLKTIRSILGHLWRLFWKRFGPRPGDFIKEYRMELINMLRSARAARDGGLIPPQAHESFDRLILDMENRIDLVEMEIAIAETRRIFNEIKNYGSPELYERIFKQISDDCDNAVQKVMEDK